MHDFDTESKETLCSSCEHLQVCSLKHVFLKVLEKANDVSVGTEDNGIIRVVDIPWLNINLSCSHFQPKNNLRILKGRPNNGGVTERRKGNDREKI